MRKTLYRASWRVWGHLAHCPWRSFFPAKVLPAYAEYPCFHLEFWWHDRSFFRSDFLFLYHFFAPFARNSSGAVRFPVPEKSMISPSSSFASSMPATSSKVTLADVSGRRRARLFPDEKYPYAYEKDHRKPWKKEWHIPASSSWRLCLNGCPLFFVWGSWSDHCLGV